MVLKDDRIRTEIFLSPLAVGGACICWVVLKWLVLLFLFEMLSFLCWIFGVVVIMCDLVYVALVLRHVNPISQTINV